MSATTPLVSVVISTYNKARYLELSLASWCQQTLRDYELIVVDDGSVDTTVDVLRQYLVRLPMQVVTVTNSGRASARNRGLERARGEYVVFCDDDRIVHPEFLEAHAAAQQAHADSAVIIGWQHGVLVELRPDISVAPEAVARALRIAPHLDALLRDGQTAWTMSAADIERDCTLVEALRIREPWFDDYVQPVITQYGDDITECAMAWSYGTTGNMSVRRADLIRVGGFDESFQGWGLEDAELHYRLIGAGARTRIAREARNYHQNHPRNDVALKWDWLRNARRFLDKHEAMDIALYIQAELTNMPLAEADRILQEARSAPDTLLRAYRRLLINHARELSTYGQMT